MHSFLFVRVISSGLMCTEIGSYQEYPVDIRFAHRSKTSWWTCLVALIQGTTIEDKNKASIKKKNCMHDKNCQFACRPGSSFSQCFSRCVEGVKPCFSRDLIGSSISGYQVLFTSWRFPEKKMAREPHFVVKYSSYLGTAIKLVLYILKQLFASVSVNSGGYLPRRSGSVNIHRYSPPLLRIIVKYCCDIECSCRTEYCQHIPSNLHQGLGYCSCIDGQVTI